MTRRPSPRTAAATTGARVTVVLVAVLLVAGCASSGGSRPSGSGSSSTGTRTPPAGAGASSSGTRTQPGAAWAHVTPARAGLDPARLDALARAAEAARSNCLLVARDGKIAGEWYFRGTGPDSAQEVFSATKSYTSTLVGIAQDDGDLRVTNPAARWIPEWTGTPAAAVTVRDLVSNDSGRAWSLAIDYVRLLAATNKTQFAIDLPQAEAPGQVWAYNNSAIQTLQQVLARATGENVVDFAQQRLFTPLGMADTRMSTDAAGNAEMFMGIQSTCRDMARFGQLFLDDGSWHGRQIVSKAWVEAATGRPSTPLNAAYGYLWWLNRPGVISSPLVATSVAAAANPTRARGQIAPGAPADLYWALGLGNQVIQVDPGSRTVVVRLGPPERNPRPPTFGPVQASQVVTEAVTR